MNRTLVLPIAGSSARFSGDKPKWALRGKDEKLMLVSSVKGIVKHFDRVVIVPLHSHTRKHEIVFDELEYEFRRMGFVNRSYHVFPIEYSDSQPETVFKGIQYGFYANSPIEGSFMVKDCDNFWQFTDEGLHKMNLGGNFVAYGHLGDNLGMNAVNKSYILFDAMEIIVNIAEKIVISDNFCVGGYGFANVLEYEKAYYQMMVAVKDRTHKGEVHLSHLIYAGMLHFNQEYTAAEVRDFIDWGTEEDWNKYNGVN